VGEQNIGLVISVLNLVLVSRIWSCFHTGTEFSVGMLRPAQGANLMRGVTQASDYTVILGDGRCEPKDPLQPDKFQCSPPKRAPNDTGDFGTFCADVNNSFPIIVRLRFRSFGDFAVLILAIFLYIRYTEVYSHVVL